MADSGAALPGDEEWMGRALALARSSVGLASPNPQVGCVLVRDGRVPGEGMHVYERYDHAEIVALKQAGDARGATAYVTLEPCSHHGRTGPCADALIAAGIVRVVVATADPNSQVSGRGLARLRAAGVEVEVGVCEAEARALNDAFACSMTRGRPLVTLKAGLSVDGFLAPAVRHERRPVFLTGEAARAEVQEMRHASDALLTGIGTVLADDPLLTDRTGLPRRRRLVRVVLDSELRMRVGARLLNGVDEDVWIFSGDGASRERIEEVTGLGARVTRVSRDAQGGLDLGEVLGHLQEAGMLSVLLEAGPGLNGAFLRAGLVDRVVLYYSQVELGAGSVPFARGMAGPFALEEKMAGLKKDGVGDDVRVSGMLNDPWVEFANGPAAIG